MSATSAGSRASSRCPAVAEPLIVVYTSTKAVWNPESPLAAPTAVLIFFWGVASFALVPPLQVRVMAAASDAPNLASSVNIGAFNLGNAIGAALGGAVIAAGLSLPFVAIAGAAASSLGLIALLLSRRSGAPRAATA